MSTTAKTESYEQRYKAAVKKAHALASEAIRESGLGGNVQYALEVNLVPDLIKHFMQDGATHAQPLTPVTPVTPVTPPVPGAKPATQPSSSLGPVQAPLQAQVFQEFLSRLPAQLRNLLRVKDHKGTEILIVNTDKLSTTDYALVCHIAEEMGGRRVSAGKDSAWHLPVTRVHLPDNQQQSR